jgi:hypothetical protein
MSDPRTTDQSGPESQKEKIAQNSAPGPDAAPQPAKKLTPEEQMELYERDLKENDWGHQPC